MDLGPVYAHLASPRRALEHLRPRIERFMRAGAIEQARSDATAALPALVELGCVELAAVAIGHLEQHFSHQWIRYLLGRDFDATVRRVIGDADAARYQQLGATTGASALVARIVSTIDTLIG
jgi:hypothetical protein